MRRYWDDRSSLLTKCCRFGPPISMEQYKEQFVSDAEGAARAAVKRLTRAIEQQLVETTINAPDW